MRTTVVFVGVGVALLVVVAVVPVWAHHAFAAEFDAQSPVELNGTVVRMEWVNPHTWIHIDVAQPDGSQERWMIEGGPPTSLLRRGFTKASLLAGTEVFARGFGQRTDRKKRTVGTSPSPTGASCFSVRLAPARRSTAGIQRKGGKYYSARV